MSRLLRHAVAIALLTGCGGAAPPTDGGPSKATPSPTKADPASPPTPSRAPPAPPAGEVAPALSVEFLREQTKLISADEMQGRQPGSEGAKRAVSHIIGTMKRIGLQPAGEDGGWAQTVAMRAVRLDPATTTLSLAANDERTPLKIGTEIVGGTYGPAGNHAVDAELVFAGYGVTAPEYEWDDFRDDVRGKIVLVFVGDPPVPGKFADEAMTYYGRWTYKFERALEAGAAGCLVIHETEPASYGWNVVESSWTSERFQIVQADGTLPPALGIQGWISSEATEAIAKRAGASLAKWHASAITKGFRPIALGITLEGKMSSEERRVEDANVIGRLPGTADPAKNILITAHWDHLGVKDTGDPTDPSNIYNGAVDNASGISGMLAVAAGLSAGEPLQHSVVFVATTAEEQGLLGSKFYAANPLVDLASIAGVINLDSMNVHGATKTIQVVGMGQSTLEDELAKVAVTQDRRLVPDEHPQSGGYYRSDHFNFAKVGVPAIYFRGGTELVDGGMEAGKKLAADRSRTYHTPQDEFDPSWPFTGALQDAQAVAALVRGIDAADAPPAWKPGSEFANVSR